MRRFRRLVAAVVAGVAVAGAAVLPAPAAAAIAYGEDVKRSVVIERAQDWHARNIQWNDGLYSWDVNHGRQYRQDCSGFVAMTWKMDGGNPNGSAGIYTGNLDNWAHEINWNDLLPGDALNKAEDHVQLFHAWVKGSDKSEFWVYELGSTASDMNHRRIGVIESRRAGYVPLRYNHIIKG